jgi:hypothetical protein
LLLPAAELISGEEELAYIKAHLSELFPAALRHLKREILAEKKMMKAEAAAKAKGLGERPIGQSSGLKPGGETAVSEKAPRATAGKRKDKELDSSDSGS